MRKIRVTTYVTAELYSVIENAAEAMEQSVSSLVEEMLQPAEPILVTLTELALTMKAAKPEHIQRAQELANQWGSVVKSLESAFDFIQAEQP